MTLSPFYEERETLAPAAREADLFLRLQPVLAAAAALPGYADRFSGCDLRAVKDRASLAMLPILRKADLPQIQASAPPFAGMLAADIGCFSRLYGSPGPIFEAEEDRQDPWGMARTLYTAGVRSGDITLNTFSYHMTPGGFIFDSAARALGCPVIPAGPGNVEQQLQLLAAFQPSVYLGVPDFLKILADAWKNAHGEVFPIRRAVVSGAALPPSLQQEFADIGLEVFQVYATADIGCIAYETPARDGLMINENLIVEIVRPGTGDPVADGEVGEVVVTNLSALRPVIRLALGDLSAVMPGTSACGRTNQRLRGWLGRADQTTKIKGMFVRPEQIAEISQRHREISKLRLVVRRSGEADAMTLYAETDAASPQTADAVAATLQSVTKLRGTVELVSTGSLPNDGKVIADERNQGAKG